MKITINPLHTNSNIKPKIVTQKITINNTPNITLSNNLTIDNNSIIKPKIITQKIAVSNANKMNDLDGLLKFKKSNKVYIIGGGTSVNNIDLNSLDGDIIAINKSIEYVKRANYFLTMDYTFIDQQKTDSNIVKQKSDSTVFILNKVYDYIVKDGTAYKDTRTGLRYGKINTFDFIIESNRFVDEKSGFGLNMESFANGENSGFCGLQLSILLGYTEIYLIGFDLRISQNNQTHFHQGYKQDIIRFRNSLIKYIDHFTKAFTKLPNNIRYSIKSCCVNSPLNNFISYVNLNTQAKKEFTVIGYYTLNTPYEQEKIFLEESCKKFGIKYYIKGVPNLGSWQKNTRYKSIFIRECLDMFNNETLMYVDVDAAFECYPFLINEFNSDISVRFQDFAWIKDECLSGTIFLKSNTKTKLMCDYWTRINDSESLNRNNLEQWNLGTIIKQMIKDNGLEFTMLPPEYVCFDHMMRIFKDIKPVIMHKQRSRLYKSKVNLK